MDDQVDVMVRHKIDANAFYRMAETGILAREHRVELIDGEIIDMAPIGQGHESTVNRLNRTLVRACGDDAIVSVQNSLRLDASNVPEPDFAIFRPRDDFYGTGERPTVADVLLLIEVADSSLNFDRTVKRAIYARAGVAEIWLVDIRNRIVEICRRPLGDRYAEITAHVAGDSVTLSIAPGITVRLGDLLG